MPFLISKKSALAPAVILALVSGCADNARDNFINADGFAVGAAAGGYVGSHIGVGTANLVNIGIGAAVGGMGGVYLASKIAQTDIPFYKDAANLSLGHAPTGKVHRWTNPESGNSGVIRSTSTAYSSNGMVCRPYRSTVTLKDKITSTDGTACQMANGRWQIVSDRFL